MSDRVNAYMNDILGFFEGPLSEEILENLLKRAGGVLRLLPPSSLRRVSHASDAVVGGPKMSYEALRGRTLLMISKTLTTKRLKWFLDHLILTRDTRTQHVQKVSDTMDTALRERFIQLNTLINELIDEINKMLRKGRDD